MAPRSSSELFAYGVNVNGFQSLTTGETRVRGSMSWLHPVAVVVLLRSGLTRPPLPTGVGKKSSDAALVERARVSIQQTCGCMKAELPHRAYMTCVKKVLKEAQLPELNLERPCRNIVLRCESKPICGNPDAVVCCRTKKSGKVVA